MAFFLACFALLVQAGFTDCFLSTAEAQNNPTSAEGSSFVLPPEPSELPPDLQVYARFTAMSPVSTGTLCPEGGQCVFGGGGGVEGELQRRWPSGWSASLGLGWSFLGGGGLYEIGVLQRLRLGFVRAFSLRRRLHPFVGASLVGAGYGDSFAIETVGGGVEVSGGLEWELTAAISIYTAASLSGLTFTGFTTAEDGIRRGGRGLPLSLFSLSVGLAVVHLR